MFQAGDFLWAKSVSLHLLIQYNYLCGCDGVSHLSWLQAQYHYNYISYGSECVKDTEKAVKL